MSKRGIFVIDLGTSKVHANVIDAGNGRLLLNDAVSYPWLRPGEERIEILSENIWDAAQSVCERILKRAEGIEIAALTFSWFGAELVTMDEHGNEVFPLIVSFDSRARKESEELRSAIPPEREALVDRGGLTPESNPAKVLWLKRNCAQQFEKVRYIGTIEQYFYRRMGFPMCAERSMAQTLQYREPDGSLMKDVIAASQITEKLLDYPVADGDGVMGELEYFGRVKLPGKIPVLYGGHDCILSQLGSGVLPAGNGVLGDVSGTYDLMGFFRTGRQLGHVDRPCSNTPLTDVYSFLQGAPTGARLSSLIDGLWGTCTGELLTGLFARARFDGGHGGLWQLDDWEKLRTDPGSLSVYGEMKVFESLVEEITFELREAYERLCRENHGTFSAVRVGGGAARSESWLQLKADVFDAVFELPENIEVSSMGAAVIAAVVLGYYPDYGTALGQMVHVRKRYEPGIPDTYARLFELWKSICRKERCA